MHPPGFNPRARGPRPRPSRIRRCRRAEMGFNPRDRGQRSRRNQAGRCHATADSDRDRLTHVAFTLSAPFQPARPHTAKTTSTSSSWSLTFQPARPQTAIATARAPTSRRSSFNPRDRRQRSRRDFPHTVPQSASLFQPARPQTAIATYGEVWRATDTLLFQPSRSRHCAPRNRTVRRGVSIHATADGDRDLRIAKDRVVKILAKSFQDAALFQSTQPQRAIATSAGAGAARLARC